MAVALAGTVRGFAGFGAGLVMMAPLSLLYGLPAAVVSVAVIDSVAIPAILKGVWPIADRRRALIAAGAAALLLPLGTYILQTSDPQLLRQLTGIGVLVFVLALALGWGWRGGEKAAALIGASAGLLGGATSLIGPPVILHFLARGEAASRTRASIAIYISVVVLSQLFVLALAEGFVGGVAGWSAWGTALMLAPAYVIGTLLGRSVFHLASPLFYRRVAMALLVAVGLLALFG